MYIFADRIQQYFMNYYNSLWYLPQRTILFLSIWSLLLVQCGIPGTVWIHVIGLRISVHNTVLSSHALLLEPFYLSKLGYCALLLFPSLFGILTLLTHAPLECFITKLLDHSLKLIDCHTLYTFFIYPFGSRTFVRVQLTISINKVAQSQHMIVNSV